MDKRFCIGKDPLRTHLGIPPICGLAIPPVNEAACNGKETTAVAALPSASSTVPALKMLMSAYMSRFRYGLEGRRLLSLFLESTHFRVVIRVFCRDMVVGAWVRGIAM